MPNNVQNILTFDCDGEQLKQILEAIQYDGDEGGPGTFDFNKVIPMPGELMIESGSSTDKGMVIYSEYLSSGLSEEEFLSRYPDTDRNEFGLGKAASLNLAKYGSRDWYDWSVKQWGTKWNSYSNDYDGGSTLTFFTAWSPPGPVIEELSARFPGVYMTHRWADEDIGSNCGEYAYLGGERTSEYIPVNEMECIEFACDVWGYEPEEIGMVLNAAGNGYIYDSGENFDVIELFGRQALFTNDRLKEEDIPQGLYLYHIRGDDDTTGGFCSIEKKVLVNHYGSVITGGPVDLGEKGYISFTPETEPGFTGISLTFREFMEAAQTEDMDIE